MDDTMNRIITALFIYLSSQTLLYAEDFKVLDLTSYAIQSDTPWFQVITDEDQWYEFYYQTLLDCPGVYPTASAESDPCALPAPYVDFETQKVVVGGLGAKPSTAFSILISNVYLTDAGEQVINVVDYEDCLGLTIIDYPMAAVVIPNTGHPLQVNVEQAKRQCD